MYKANQAQHKESRRYAYKHWCIDNQDKFAAVIEKFMPIPNWPKDWRKYLKE
jgi:hypothetical protein